MAIQLRRGSRDARLDATKGAEKLKAGQPFYEKDYSMLYVGDGTTALNKLKPIAANKLLSSDVDSGDSVCVQVNGHESRVELQGSSIWADAYNDRLIMDGETLSGNIGWMDADEYKLKFTLGGDTYFEDHSGNQRIIFDNESSVTGTDSNKLIVMDDVTKKAHTYTETQTYQKGLTTSTINASGGSSGSLFLNAGSKMTLSTPGGTVDFSTLSGGSSLTFKNSNKTVTLPLTNTGSVVVANTAYGYYDYVLTGTGTAGVPEWRQKNYSKTILYTEKTGTVSKTEYSQLSDYSSFIRIQKDQSLVYCYPVSGVIAGRLTFKSLNGVYTVTFAPIASSTNTSTWTLTTNEAETIDRGITFTGKVVVENAPTFQAGAYFDNQNGSRSTKLLSGETTAEEAAEVYLPCIESYGSNPDSVTIPAYETAPSGHGYFLVSGSDDTRACKWRGLSYYNINFALYRSGSGSNAIYVSWGVVAPSGATSVQNLIADMTSDQDEKINIPTSTTSYTYGGKTYSLCYLYTDGTPSGTTIYNTDGTSFKFNNPSVDTIGSIAAEYRYFQRS